MSTPPPSTEYLVLGVHFILGIEIYNPYVSETSTNRSRDDGKSYDKDSL
jgi:hypothetical protein